MTLIGWAFVGVTIVAIALLWLAAYLQDRLEAERSRVRYWQDRALRSPWRACGCGKGDDHAA